MPEKVMPGPVSDLSGIREAVCIHTRKIYDSCREEDTAPYILFFSIQFRSDVQNEFQFKICGFALLFLVIDDFLYD